MPVTIAPDFIVNTTTLGNHYLSSVATLANGNLLYVWMDTSSGTSQIRGRITPPGDVSSGSDFLIASAPGVGVTLPNVVVSASGAAVVSFVTTESDSPGGPVYNNVRYITIDPANPVSGPGTKLSSVSGDMWVMDKVNSVALPDGRVVMTYDIDTQVNGGSVSVRSRVLDPSNGTYVDFDLHTTPTNTGDSPDVTLLPDGRLFYVWVDAYGGPAEMAGRIVDLTNVGASTPFTIATNGMTGTMDQRVFVEALDDGRVAVVWNAAQDSTTPAGTRVKIFDPDTPGTVTEFSVSGMGYPTALTVLPNGLIFVVGGGSDGNNSGIVGRFIDPADPTAFSTFVVNSTTDGEQAHPDVTVLPDGRVAVTWSSLDASGSDTSDRKVRSTIITAPDFTSSADTIVGSSGNNNYYARPAFLNAGDDVDGGAGIDTLYLEAPGVMNITAPDVFENIERLIGSSGNDTFLVSNSRLQSITLISGGLGTDVIQMASAGTLDLSAVLTSSVESIRGSTGVDVITGTTLNDVIDGDGGADTLRGGTGNDTYYFGSGDTITELAGEGTDTVYASAHFTLSANVEVLRLQGTANYSGTGNSGANTLFGNTGNNTLNGGTGADSLRGGAGNDIYVIDNIGDRVVELDGEGTDLIQSSVSFLLGNLPEIENLTLTGSSVIYGGGNDARNVIVGNTAANILDGRLGSDTLIGGSGADTFRFTTALGSTNIDKITDFTTATDKIGLDNGIMTKLGSGGVFKAANFVLGTAALDAADRLIYDKAAGRLYYDADGNGAGAKQLVVILNANTTLVASDILVI